MAMPRPYATEVALTGLTRHRVTWRGRLVLQVEEQYKLRQCFTVHPTVYFRWRDACVFDLQILTPLKVGQEVKS